MIDLGILKGSSFVVLGLTTMRPRAMPQRRPG
jgi:hypothetical protein